MNLTIDDKKVLEAAEKCPQAKTVLQTLFPDVFGDPKMVDCTEKLGSIVQVRSCSDEKYDKKSFFLDRRYDWKIELDASGVSCLVPRRK